jgi:hypothetical protein
MGPRIWTPGQKDDRSHNFYLFTSFQRRVFRTCQRGGRLDCQVLGRQKFGRTTRDIPNKWRREQYRWAPFERTRPGCDRDVRVFSWVPSLVHLGLIELYRTDLLATFPTKRTPIISVHFTPRNLCLVAGPYLSTTAR